MKDPQEDMAGTGGQEFHSRDSDIVIIDGPGDATVRPLWPSLRPQAEALLEKIRRWGGITENGTSREE